MQTLSTDSLEMSQEQQGIMLEYAKETSSGGQPSPDLVTRMNSMDLILGTEKFRAQKIVARHNQDVIDHVNQTIAQYKQWGEPISELPDYELHPTLWEVVQVPNGFGGGYWTWAPGQPYSG